jgi:hypothetical protein
MPAADEPGNEGSLVLEATDPARGLTAAPRREQTHDLSVGPGLSVYPDLSVGVPETGSVGALAKEHGARGTSDAALLAGVSRVAATVEVLVGAWLTASPWLVGSNGSTALRWSNLVVGVLLVVLGVLRLSRAATPRGPAISFGLGAWTIVAAFVLSFQNGATGTAPLWSAIACGAVLTGAAAWATTEAERAGLHQL